MFRGAGGEDEGFAPPQTTVQVNDLDEGRLPELAVAATVLTRLGGAVRAARPSPELYGDRVGLPNETAATDYFNEALGQGLLAWEEPRVTVATTQTGQPSPALPWQRGVSASKVQETGSLLRRPLDDHTCPGALSTTSSYRLEGLGGKF